MKTPPTNGNRSWEFHGGYAGESSLELPICLPLPTMSAWAALALQAYRLNLVKAARPAVSVLQSHFILSAPECAVWQAHPMSCMTLCSDRAAVSSPGLLRAFAMVCYVHAGQHLNVLGRAAASNDQAVSVRSHVQRLKLVKQLLIGIQVLLQAWYTSHMHVHSAEHLWCPCETPPNFSDRVSLSAATCQILQDCQSDLATSKNGVQNHDNRTVGIDSWYQVLGRKYVCSHLRCVVMCVCRPLCIAGMNWCSLRGWWTPTTPFCPSFT